MATKNLVPRGSGEGSIGTSSKKWNDAHFVSGTFDSLKVKDLKDSLGAPIIKADNTGASTVTIGVEDTGAYTIKVDGGSNDAVSNKIFQLNSKIEVLDDDSNPSKIEITLDNNKFWEIQSDGDFIPFGTTKPSIGSSDNKITDIYLDGKITFGTALLRYSSNKLQLANDGANYSNIITAADLTSYLTDELQTLQDVVSLGATSDTAVTIKGVVIGSSEKEIKLNKVISTVDNENIVIRPSGNSGKVKIGGSNDDTSVDISQGIISIKSNTSVPAYIELYNNANDHKTTLKSSDVDAYRALTLPNATGVLALKSEVDAMASGIKVQKTVKAATVGSFTMADTASTTTLVLANGEGGFNATTDKYIVDTVELSENDRVLIKDSVSAAGDLYSHKWNGIYVVGALTNATLTLTRADDFDSGDSVAGYFVFVEDGSTNADKGFVCTSNSPNDNPNGTNLITFAQFTKAGQITAGEGLTKTGQELKVDATLGHVTGVGTLTSLAAGATALSSTLSVEGAATFKGGIKLQDDPSNNTNTIELKAPATANLTADYSLVLPTTITDKNDKFLKVSVSGTTGTLSWDDAGGLASVSADTAPALGGNLTTSTYKIVGNLIPEATGTRSLGSESLKWNNLYSDNIYFGDYKIYHETANSRDDLIISNKNASNEATTLVVQTNDTENNRAAEIKILGNYWSRTGALTFDYKTNNGNYTDGVNTPEKRTARIVHTIASHSILSYVDNNSTQWVPDYVGLNFVLGNTLPNYGASAGSNGEGYRSSIINSVSDVKLHIGRNSTTFHTRLDIKNINNATSGSVRFYDSQINFEQNERYIEIKAPLDVPSNYTLTLPENAPSSVSTSNNRMLISDSTGTLSWVEHASLSLNDFGELTSLGDTDDIAINNSSTNKKITAKRAKSYMLGLKSDSDISIVTSDSSNDFSKATIVNNKVTLGKIQQVASKKVLGNLTGDAANVSEITVSTDDTLGAVSYTHLRAHET